MCTFWVHKICNPSNKMAAFESYIIGKCCGKGWRTCTYPFSYPADLRPGTEPTNKIFQKIHPKSIIRASQKAQQDVNVARAPLAGEQRNIAAHSFVPFMLYVFGNFQLKMQTMTLN